MSSAVNKKWPGIVKIAAVVFVVGLGIWGFARKPDSRADGERVRSLEGRCVKLEQDYRTVAQARDKARRDLAVLERDAIDRELLLRERDEARRQAEESRKELTRTARQLDQRTGERDDLRRDLDLKTAERDTVMGRYDRLRRGLQAMMAQDDDTQQGTAAVPTPVNNAPTISVPVTGPMLGGKS